MKDPGRLPWDKVELELSSTPDLNIQDVPVLDDWADVLGRVSDVVCTDVVIR